MKTICALIASGCLVLGAAPASAELPQGVQAMIEAAIATDDAAKVSTVLDLARATHPDDAATIDAIEAEWKASQAAKHAAAEAARKKAISEAGIFARWSGEGEFGGFHSTGNTESIGVTTALQLKREGLKWTHLLRARADYQRQNGATSREQFVAAYEPRWQFNDDLFLYGLAQFERDRLQGFDARYAASGGLGYKIVEDEGVSLSVKAGPAWRITEYTDGTNASRIAGLFGADFDWQIVEGLTFTQDANALAEGGGEVQVLIDGNNTSINLVSGLDFKISEKLRSRLSYAVDYNSNPPADTEATDTITRFSVVYGF